MSYEKKRIIDVIKEIESGKIYLPAIQRKFVWDKEQIELFFDSLMRNFPIGTFLFWFLGKKKAHEYVFYEFLRSYDERNPYNDRKKGSFLHSEIIGVLDGQQRLSSLYIALQGTYKEKLKYLRKSSTYAYPETSLYLNLLNLPYKEVIMDKQNILDIDDENDFEFSFLEDSDAKKNIRYNSDKKINEPCYWFKVGEVLKWPTDPEIYRNIETMLQSLNDEDQKKLFQKNNRYIQKAITDLHKRITNDYLINYFKVTKEDLDDILKIFIRVNSGGTILSKTDLLFSTIVATWEKGRDEIESFTKGINDKGEGFDFDNDFIMRCCLVLTDLQVLFKANSFKSENVSKIKNAWPEIKIAINKTVDLLIDFGFSGKLLTSQNAVIIIAYYLIKGGAINNVISGNIRKYLLHALLKNVYGGQGDQIISSLRNFLRTEKLDKQNNKYYELKSKEFSFIQLSEAKLSANKSLQITEENIEDFMNHHKGASSFLVLSFIYPNLRYREVHFHQDHIHPDSGFTDSKLKEAQIPPERWGDWKIMKDRVPNLQLMEGRQNESKNKTPLITWLNGSVNGKPNVADKRKFFDDNYFPEDADLEFPAFETFYNNRRLKLIQELKTVLGIHDTTG